MRRVLVGLGLLLTAFALVACGSDADGDSAGGNGGDGGAGDRSEDDSSSAPVGRDGLTYLTVTGLGVSRIDIESGEATQVASAEDLGLGPGQLLTLVRLSDGLLWAAVYTQGGTLGAGRLVAIDPRSGELEREVEFSSSQTITDFAFAGGLLWVQVGFAFGDAVLLGLDPDSGDILFTVEPPADTKIGGMAAGDGAVWMIGGDPEKLSPISRLEAGSGAVTGIFDAGLVASYIVVGAGGIWVGGGQFEFEGKEGNAVARLDPETGELLATIEIGHPTSSIVSLIEYNGAIWVTDTIGPGGAGAQLHRIDPATNSITATIEVGASGYGSLDLIAGDGYIFAINSIDQQTYIINAETAEGEIVLTGPTRPIAIP